MLASVLGAPEQNEFFGATPGEVPYDMDVDASQLVQQPYKADNIWGKMQGSPATRANASYAQGMEMADTRFQQQVQMARERAMVEAAQRQMEEQAKLAAEMAAAAPGGLIEQQNAARYRSQIAGENMQRENAVTNLYPTLSPGMPDGPRAATAPSAVRGSITDLINNYGYDNVVKNGILNAQAATQKGQADSRMAAFNADTQPQAFDTWQQSQNATIAGNELANDKARAESWLNGSTPISNPLVWGNGRFISLNKGQEGKPGFGVPGQEGYIPAVPGTPDTPFMGGMPGAFFLPGVGMFAPRKTPEAAVEPGVTSLSPTPKGATPMQAPKAPELRGSNVFTDFMDYMRSTGGKRDGESWAEYEKRKAKR
jgi:hypothetical protein